MSNIPRSKQWSCGPAGPASLLSFCYVICAVYPFRKDCDSSLQGLRPGRCYSASVDRTPSETSPDRDIVTSPPDMDRDKPTRVRTRDRGGKCKVIIEFNAILFEKCKGCIHLTSCPEKCGGRAHAHRYCEGAEPTVMNMHEVSELARG